MVTYNVKKAGITVQSDQTPATTPASSSTATLSTPTSPSPSTETIQVLLEKLQHSGSTDNQSHTSSASTCATMQAHIVQYLHELRATLQKIMPLPFGADGRQPVHCLVLAPLAQDLVAAPASQAYVERVFSVCGWLTAGR